MAWAIKEKKQRDRLIWVGPATYEKEDWCWAYKGERKTFQELRIAKAYLRACRQTYPTKMFVLVRVKEQ